MRLDPLVMDRWEPAVQDRRPPWQEIEPMGSAPGRRPPAGSVITTRKWREPFRVVRVDEIDRVLWTPEERDAVEGYAEKFQQEHAPIRIVLTRPDVDPTDKDHWHAVRVNPQARYDWYFLLPEHYATCRSCGELAPCREVTAQRKAVAAMERQAEVDAKLMPGCCPACGEPVTSRQQAVTFPGENLLSPLAHWSPRFHLRRRCLSSAERYEEKWVAADPTRQPSMLTAKCAGTLITHQDGDQECTRPLDCPGLPAHHGCLSGCFGERDTGLRSAGEALGFRVDERNPCTHGCTPDGRGGARGAPWREFGEHGQPVA